MRSPAPHKDKRMIADRELTDNPRSTKTCSDCGKTKTAADFYVHKQTRDGLYPYCKQCGSERSKLNYQRNIEKARARRKAYYAAHCEEAKAAAKAWAATNADKVAERRQRYLESHREQEKRRSRQWATANPDRVRHQNRLKKARSRGAEVCSLTLTEWEAIVAAYGSRCAYCGCRPERLEMDHVIPLSKGGQHASDNVVPACQPCNARKHDKPAPKFNRIPISQIFPRTEVK